MRLLLPPVASCSHVALLAWSHVSGTICQVKPAGAGAARRTGCVLNIGNGDATIHRGLSWC